MILFSPVEDLDSPEFQAAIHIYEEAFPLKERVPTFVLMRNVHNRTSHLFVGQQDGRVVLMAILCAPILEQFVLLGYLATHKDYRNQGIGANFIREILEVLQSRSQYLLLEVEDPQTGIDQELKQRRVNFYRRLGAKQLKNVRYILPPLSGGETTEMILMLAPEYPHPLPGEQVKQLMAELYVTLYQRRVDDPFLRSSWEGIGSWVEFV